MAEVRPILSRQSRGFFITQGLVPPSSIPHRGHSGILHQDRPTSAACRAFFRSGLSGKPACSTGFAAKYPFSADPLGQRHQYTTSLPCIVPSSSAAMASTTPVPYAEQDHQAVQNLVAALNKTVDKGKRNWRSKKTTYEVEGSRNDITVDSWRFQDWDYKRRDLPTYARGLFTTKNSRGQHEIAVRGYDKFFNVDETNETKWPNLLGQTQGPYELTLKENGCIIFIAGLEDESLVVCSKHSTGARSDVEMSHSVAGERWVDRQLATIGKTRAHLARELRARNATAVAELCDDDFEEHILAYGPDKAGLYLHGMNLNMPEFMTYPSEHVQKFADEWGFRKVGVTLFDDITAVKTFLEGVAETGAHEGRDVEGFVIRCRRSPKPESIPYHDWFWKYKFDEPYLMYRQWRECTKALISGKPPKFKKHVKITEEYLLYARKRLAQDPNLGKLYNQNHGIIKLRDDFLAYKHMKGSDAANVEKELGFDDDSSSVTSGIVIVPIATIGCGKTTVAVSLTNLFSQWGHVQNDNIQGRGRPAQMVQKIMQLLADGHPVVISDRNNSERREREQIIKDVKLQHAEARLVAMNFSHGDIEEVRRVTRERVLARGDNHQTIQAASDEDKVISIMENFIHRFQPCDPENSPDYGFDLVVDLDPSKSSRENLETMVTKLHKKYPKLIPELPSADAMDEAVKAAIDDYAPSLKHTLPDRTNKNDKAQTQPKKPAKKKPLEYMSISVPASHVNGTLQAAFADADADASKFYKLLKGTRRIQPQFHITLMHRARSKDYPEKWAEYVKLDEESAANGGRIAECDVELERVVFDDRIMAIVVRILDPAWSTVNPVAHVTVGTRDQSVKPKESNDLLARWLQEGTGGNIGERVFESKPVIKGVVRGVLAR